MNSTVLHLGLGAFHRAHQAAVLQALQDEGNRQWSLTSGNLRAEPIDTARLLARQGHVYTLETVNPQGMRRHQRITALTHAVPYQSDLAPLVEWGARAQTRIISFTVTEAGYGLPPDGTVPLQSLYGALVAILRERQRRGAGPVTLLSCDNLRHNGDQVREGLLQAIERIGDADLLHWVQDHTTCPNAMVDRITPRVSPDLAGRVRAALGWDDAVPVMAEDYLQWVIEDRFCNGRPLWERVGVEMVADVTPYEEAKVRMLNASHSVMAWAGVLAGHLTVDQAARDQRIHALAQAYLTDEVIPCLDRDGAPRPLDLPRYRDVVLARFRNAALGDTLQRVAADSHAKVPAFIAPTLRQRLDQGLPIAHGAVLVALYLAFLRCWQSGSLPFDHADQVLSPQAAAALCTAADPVGALCADATLWASHAGDERLLQAVRLADVQLSAMFWR